MIYAQKSRLRPLKGQALIETLIVVFSMSVVTLGLLSLGMSAFERFSCLVMTQKAALIHRAKSLPPFYDAKLKTHHKREGVRLTVTKKCLGRNETYEMHYLHSKTF